MGTKRIALSVGPQTSKALTAVARNLNKSTGMGWTSQEVLTAAASQGLAQMVKTGHPSVTVGNILAD